MNPLSSSLPPGNSPQERAHVPNQKEDILYEKPKKGKDTAKKRNSVISLFDYKRNEKKEIEALKAMRDNLDPTKFTGTDPFTESSQWQPDTSAKERPSKTPMRLPSFLHKTKLQRLAIETAFEEKPIQPTIQTPTKFAKDEPILKPTWSPDNVYTAMGNPPEEVWSIKPQNRNRSNTLTLGRNPNAAHVLYQKKSEVQEAIYSPLPFDGDKVQFEARKQAWLADQAQLALKESEWIPHGESKPYEGELEREHKKWIIEQAKNIFLLGNFPTTLDVETATKILSDLRDILYAADCFDCDDPQKAKKATKAITKRDRFFVDALQLKESTREPNFGKVLNKNGYDTVKALLKLYLDTPYLGLCPARPQRRDLITHYVTAVKKSLMNDPSTMAVQFPSDLIGNLGDDHGELMPVQCPDGILVSWDFSRKELSKKSKDARDKQFKKIVDKCLQNIDFRNAKRCKEVKDSAKAFFFDEITDLFYVVEYFNDQKQLLDVYQSSLVKYPPPEAVLDKLEQSLRPEDYSEHEAEFVVNDMLQVREALRGTGSEREIHDKLSEVVKERVSYRDLLKLCLHTPLLGLMEKRQQGLLIDYVLSMHHSVLVQQGVFEQ